VHYNILYCSSRALQYIILFIPCITIYYIVHPVHYNILYCSSRASQYIRTLVTPTDARFYICTLLLNSYMFRHFRNPRGTYGMVDYVWNVMAHAQKPDFVFRQNGRVHLNRQVRQFSRLLAAEVCASAVAILDTPCSEVVWRGLATHSIRQFPLHFPSRASPCAVTFQLDSTS